MELMEPKDIDWSRVVSRFVRDDTYEGIEAPHWADLNDPNAGRADIDDDAWFCRPDCRHPKTAEDFRRLSASPSPSPKGKLLRSVSAMMPFGERDPNAANPRDGNNNNNNLKWRGAGPAGGAVATFISPNKPKAAAAAPKRRVFLEDSENQDPALAAPPPSAGSRPPLGAARWAKNASKEAFKSSAEKKRPDGGDAEKEALLAAPPRQLKSTLSARNLFSGKDILGQISEFYDELKRMVGGRPVTDTAEEEHGSNPPLNESDVVDEKVGADGGASDPVPSPVVKEVPRQEAVQKSPSPIKGKKVGLKVEAGKERAPSVLKEVKATPPTPQRFPSPSANRIKNVKAGGMAAAGSPLKKPLKDKGTPSKDPENKRGPMRQPFGVKDMNNTRACDAEGSSSSMFWFLKPCTFLVE